MLLIAWSFAKVKLLKVIKRVFGSNKKLVEKKYQNGCDDPLLNRSIIYVPLLLLLPKASESESAKYFRY